LICERLEIKGVALKVLDQAIDTSNCTGRLMFNMLGAIAQFEREAPILKSPTLIMLALKERFPCN
jgi:DNA invertase Pin-like site-specific DNA recombinase